MVENKRARNKKAKMVKATNKKVKTTKRSKRHKTIKRPKSAKRPKRSKISNNTKKNRSASKNKNRAVRKMRRVSRSSQISDSEHIPFKGFLSFLILHELRNRKLYGEQLAKLIGKRRGDHLTPGTIYPALKQLRNQHLIRFIQDGQKKIYTLTSSGKSELRHLYRLFGRYFKGLKSKIKYIKSSKRIEKNV